VVVAIDLPTNIHPVSNGGGFSLRTQLGDRDP